MRYYIYTTDTGEHFLHSQDAGQYSLQLLDAKLNPTAFRFTFSHEQFDSAVNAGLARMAVADNEERTIRVFEAGEDTPFAQLKRSSFGAMIMSPGGEQLTIKSSGGFFHWDLSTDSLNKISLQVDDLACGVPCGDGRKWVIPGRKKGVLALLDLEHGTYEDRSLPFSCTFYRLKRSPVNGSLIGIGKDKTLYLFSPDIGQLVEAIPLKKHARGGHIGAGCFSGDGKFFAATVAGGGANRMAIVDIANAVYSHEIPTVCYDLPHVGSWVRDAATRDGTYEFRVVDLATGDESVEELRNPNHVTHSSMSDSGRR